MRVCLSFAAYARNLIENLKSSNVIIENGLTEAEFTSIESSLSFRFPPDLRSILQEGLPVSRGFPNWRSLSKTQLEILINLPFLQIQKQVSMGTFWIEEWGEKPIDFDQAVSKAKGFLKKAPLLVPVYKYFYIPVRPFMAGNPIFYVHGGATKIWSFDIAGFFEQIELGKNGEGVFRRPTLLKLLNLPPWAATEARLIEFWTEFVVARGDANWWCGGALEECLEVVLGRLRSGGWKEEDVREMMQMDGGDEFEFSNDSSKSVDSSLLRFDRTSDTGGKRTNLLTKDRVDRHARLLSKSLLRAGWSVKDVIDMLNGGIVDDVDSSL